MSVSFHPPRSYCPDPRPTCLAMELGEPSYFRLHPSESCVFGKDPSDARLALIQWAGLPPHAIVIAPRASDSTFDLSNYVRPRTCPIRLKSAAHQVRLRRAKRSAVSPTTENRCARLNEYETAGTTGLHRFGWVRVFQSPAHTKS